ncbi:PilZ domain-containing protein [Aliikangiella coralliicola]|uniref:Cyclic diguanosine monophosphate-binding protein n=1 Tax=Aliikangiella coralliicola TaxID=2592383 RepID=A0A545U772_9GAMM|nr:PilZ domain-containing protein [Aliikangiella coralliicola]TQV85326.1 PilZ domain-containing protein [Aliikangiella coralliicola]
MIDERRQFNRVAFNTVATLTIDKLETECQIVDLSLHGVLLKLMGIFDTEIGSTYQIEIPLGEDNELIAMELELMHQNENGLGLMCTNIDLDSITHLRRLVELNLGDSELLERDFSSLIKDNE